MLPPTNGDLDEQKGQLKKSRFIKRSIPITAPVTQSGMRRQRPVKNITLPTTESCITNPIKTQRNSSGANAQSLIHNLKDGVIAISLPNGYWVTFGAEGVALKMVRGSP